jgi:ribonuclease BN (tRNA processing enzyme)
MKLQFLGTRGEIEARTSCHRRHASLLVSYRRRRVMVDCGADWNRAVWRIRPHAIVLTHAHPDHAFGLRGGLPVRCGPRRTAGGLCRLIPISIG